MEESQDREYEYKPRWLAISLGVLLCGTGAIIAASLAISNCGLKIWGIRLPPEIATGTWWTLAVTSLGGGFVFLLMAALRLIRTQRIVLTPAAIIVPKGRFSTKVVAIPFATIIDLSRSQVYSQGFLKITHQRGTFTIASSLLPEKEDFEAVHNVLVKRVGHEKGGITGFWEEKRGPH